MNADASLPRTESACRLPGASSHAVTAALALFIVIGTTTAANLLGHFWTIQPLLNAAFLVAVLLASMAALTPALAWPNVLLAAGLAGAITSITHGINAVIGLPFGRFDFTAAAGPRLFGLVPWWLPMIWCGIALTTRGVARLILHHSRQHPFHGWRVIAFATLLALLFNIGLDSFAIHAASYWTPHTAPLLNLASCTILNLFIQIVITPLLIDKFPRPRPLNLRPLLVWSGVNGLLALGLLHHGLWIEGTVPATAAIALAALGLQIRWNSVFSGPTLNARKH